MCGIDPLWFYNCIIHIIHLFLKNSNRLVIYMASCSSPGVSGRWWRWYWRLSTMGPWDARLVEMLLASSVSWCSVAKYTTKTGVKATVCWLVIFLTIFCGLLHLQPMLWGVVLCCVVLCDLRLVFAQDMLQRAAKDLMVRDGRFS